MSPKFTTLENDHKTFSKCFNICDDIYDDCISSVEITFLLTWEQILVKLFDEVSRWPLNKFQP